jgi:hypothetical protein
MKVSVKNIKASATSHNRLYMLRRRLYSEIFLLTNNGKPINRDLYV